MILLKMDLSQLILKLFSRYDFLQQNVFQANSLITKLLLYFPRTQVLHKKHIVKMPKSTVLELC